MHIVECRSNLQIAIAHDGETISAIGNPTYVSKKDTGNLDSKQEKTNIRGHERTHLHIQYIYANIHIYMCVCISNYVFMFTFL